MSYRKLFNGMSAQHFEARAKLLVITKRIGADATAMLLADIHGDLADHGEDVALNSMQADILERAAGDLGWRT
jgi:hypothetical protein